MGRGGGGCYTGKDEKTGKLTARRREFDPIPEPPYRMSTVTECRKDFENSVLLRPFHREAWFTYVPEMLLLCNEAAKRNVRKSISVPKENADGLLSKPLGLEYIADRVDTDDPIQGYLVRTRDEGWLQGFITVTTFTTWHREFEWNSLVQEAGISDEDKQNHRWDFDGSLAKELQKQKRVGDPHREGIVWKRLAEVSLLGALGCGSQLLQLVMEDLEQGDEYDYIILQATDNAISFYERMGFVRVGAIARPDQNFLNRKGKVSTGEKPGVGNKNKEEAVTIKREKMKFRREKVTASYDWRPFCVKVLKHLLTLPEAKVIKDSRPSAFKFEQQRCLDLQSLVDALRDKESEEQKKMMQEHHEFDPTSWMKTAWISNFTNAEDVSFEVQLLLNSFKKDPNLNETVKSAAQSLLDSFCKAWNSFGDDLVTDGSQGEKYTPKKAGTNHTPTKSARLRESATKEEEASKMGKDNQFYVYVDIEWREQRGFRLYEIVGKLNGSANKQSGSKGLLNVREWYSAKELEPAEGADRDNLPFLPRSAKAKKMQWSQRRCVDGILQTASLPVAVRSCHKQLDGKRVDYIEVEDQCLRVTMAYAKLMAIRGIERFERYGDGGYDSRWDGEGSGSPDDTKLSEYEFKRLQRMQENERLMKATGILDHEQSVTQGSSSENEDAADAHDDTCSNRKQDAMLGDLNDVRPRSQSQSMNGEESVDSDGTTDSAQKPHRPQKKRFLPLDSHGSPKVFRSLDMDSVSSQSKKKFVAEEETSIKKIAEECHVKLDRLLQINRGNFPDLHQYSIIPAGTVLQLPRPGEVCEFIPKKKLPRAPTGWSGYCHWTYPDQSIDELFPSYMMAKKIIREKDGVVKQAPSTLRKMLVDCPPPIVSTKEIQQVRKISKLNSEFWQEQHSSMQDGEEQEAAACSWPVNGIYCCLQNERAEDVAKKFRVDADRLIFVNKLLNPQLEQRRAFKAGSSVVLPLHPSLVEQQNWIKDCVEILDLLRQSQHALHFEAPVEWRRMKLFEYPFIVTQPTDLGTVQMRLLAGHYATPEDFAEATMKIFFNAIVFNNTPNDTFRKMANKLMSNFEHRWSKIYPPLSPAILGDRSKKVKFFNKVVKLEDESALFYFVLHYVPDLHWCHLAPMQRDGLVPYQNKQGKPNAYAGHTKWKLVPEGEAEEIDVSGFRCIPVRSVTVNKTKNADLEAWVILGEGGGEGQEMDVQSNTQESADCESEEGRRCRKIERVPARLQEEGGRAECARALRRMLADAAYKLKTQRGRRSVEQEGLRLRLKGLAEQEDEFEDASSFVQAVLDAMTTTVAGLRRNKEKEKRKAMLTYQAFHSACERLSCFDEISCLFDPKLVKDGHGDEEDQEEVVDADEDESDDGSFGEDSGGDESEDGAREGGGEGDEDMEDGARAGSSEGEEGEKGNPDGVGEERERRKSSAEDSEHGKGKRQRGYNEDKDEDDRVLGDIEEEAENDIEEGGCGDEEEEEEEEEEGGGKGNSKAAGKTKVKVKVEEGAPEDSEDREEEGEVEYTTRENETPRIIAAMLRVNLDRVLELNRSKYPQLVPCSRFRRGTKLLLPMSATESPKGKELLARKRLVKISKRGRKHRGDGERRRGGRREESGGKLKV